jgi:hypothetical protein
MNDADENPMWAGLATLAGETGDRPVDLACRIAVPSAGMTALIGPDVPAGQVARFPTWDAPHTLLADDEALAEAVRSLGIPVARPVSPYAVRQWDEREALEGALHRFRDHDERPWGMSAYEPRTGVVLALGLATVRGLIGRLVREVAQSGLVIDARQAQDLRVFALDVLERGRVVLVTREGVEDVRGPEVERVLGAVCGG